MGKEKVTKYQQETINIIRSLGTDFDDFTDEQIMGFYSRWSEQEFSAGWMGGDVYAKAFYTYATTKPIDVERKLMK